MKNKPIINKFLTAGCVVSFAGAMLFAVAGPQEDVKSQTDTPPFASDKAASVGNLIGGLEARLASNPEDAKGWTLLARSHDHLGNHEEAWQAYSRARELGMTDESLELKLAANMAGSLQP